MRLIDGQRPDLVKVATQADLRRKIGEDLGLPPVPTSPSKHNYHIHG